MSAERTDEARGRDDGGILQKRLDRRRALAVLLGGAATGAAALGACTPASAASDEEREAKLLKWREYIKGNYRFMTDEERSDTVARLERLAHLQRGIDVAIQTTPAQPGVMFG